MRDFLAQNQEPVEWESISVAGPCKLNGSYGWYSRVAIEQVFIRANVFGCEFPTDAKVLTWAEVEDPDTPGNIEGFYCSLTYSQEESSAVRFSIDVQTHTGT